jgi:hypothetical protein
VSSHWGRRVSNRAGSRRTVDSPIANVLSLLILLATATECASPLPRVRSAGPVFSEEGIHLAVVGQNCNQSRDPGQTRTDLVDTTLAIEVGNPLSSPVTVHRDRLLLKLSDGTVVRTYTPVAGEVMAVEGGVTVTFTLSFMVPRASCSQDMRLGSNSALVFRGQPVNIDAIRFVSAGSP